MIHPSGIVEEVLDSLGDTSKVQLGVAYISPRLFPFSQYSKILKNLTNKEIRKAIVLEIPTDPEHGVDYPALKLAVESKEINCCILNSNFHNPLGSLMSDSKKEKVVGLLNDHDIPLIEDDIYSDLYYEKQRLSF